jgi:dsRNA-specific ribonuclease
MILPKKVRKNIKNETLIFLGDEIMRLTIDKK